MISHSLNKPKSWVLSHGEYKLTPEEIQKLQNQFSNYLDGVPLPYLIGEWEFYGRKFKVTPDVLIPRPETELLVDLAVKYGQKKESLSIIDVGTGSGIIAVSLAAALPNAKVYAVDISMAALKIAKENARFHRQNKVNLIQANLIAPFRGNFDLICANLPYIPSLRLETLDVSRWEPHLALDGGSSGLELIERLLIQAKTNLSKDGAIVLEIEASLGVESLEVAHKIMPNAMKNLHKDLAGKDRVIEIQLS